MRPVLIVGGAPRVRIDAVRFLQASASGATAVALRGLLAARGGGADLLLAPDAAPGEAAGRYADRDELETRLGAWIAAHPDGAVVMSAAVNDYAVAEVDSRAAGAVRAWRRDDKVPSGCDEVVIRLRPAAKLIDQLGPRFGLRGPIVGFKFEDRATVIASAESLRRRVGAALVVANSLCGEVQALVEAERTMRFADRAGLLAALADHLIRL